MKTANAVINEFQAATQAEYGSQGFASGFLGGLLNEVLEELPKSRKHDILLTLRRYSELSRSIAAKKELSKSL